MPSSRLSVLASLLRDILIAVTAGIGLAILLYFVQARLVSGHLTLDELHYLQAGVIVLLGYFFSRAVGAAVRRSRGEEKVRDAVLRVFFQRFGGGADAPAMTSDPASRLGGAAPRTNP